MYNYVGAMQFNSLFKWGMDQFVNKKLGGPQTVREVLILNMTALPRRDGVLPFSLACLFVTKYIVL